jgi:hypothetical protein
MSTAAFLDRLKDRCAELAVGPSTLRRQGASGVVDAARRGLRKIDLLTFAVADESAFRARLDEATAALQVVLDSVFPEEGRNIDARWGGARKVLNIFLRDVIYNADLIAHFNLHHVRPWLEVPLDSYVAAGLKGEPEGMRLPRWPGVKYLRREASDQYQTVASAVAERRGVTRIDLDVFYFREEGVAPDQVQ